MRGDEGAASRLKTSYTYSGSHAPGNAARSDLSPLRLQVADEERTHPPHLSELRSQDELGTTPAREGEEGVRMQKLKTPEHARISRVDFVIEDHGILGFNVDFVGLPGEHWGQGTGLYSVDMPEGEERVGNRMGVWLIRAFLDHFGVRDLNGLVDKECFVYRVDGRIVGVRYTRADKPLMFVERMESLDVEKVRA